MRNADRIWWEEITGPASIVEKAVSSLRENRCVVLALPEHAPWVDMMRSSIDDGLQGENLLRGDAPRYPENPGDALLARFAQDAVRTGFRATGGVTMADYLVKNRVLHDHLIWVKDLPSASASVWLDFVRQYRKCSMENGLFILEIPQDMPLQQMPAHMQLVRYDECVSDYDMPLFCSSLVSEHKGTAAWKMYLSTLAWMLSGGDAQLANAFLVDLRDEQREPESVILHTYTCMNAQPMPDHEVNSLPTKVWQAQIKALYPLLEDRRIEFVTRWYGQIEKALSQAGDHAMVMGERISDPYDAEWGVLYHLAHVHIENNLRLLYIPNQDDYEALAFFRDCRNRLAHRNRLEHANVKRLLS